MIIIDSRAPSARHNGGPPIDGTSTEKVRAHRQRREQDGLKRVEVSIPVGDHEILRVFAEALRAGGEAGDRARRAAWILDQVVLPRIQERGRPDPDRLGFGRRSVNGPVGRLYRQLSAIVGRGRTRS